MIQTFEETKDLGMMRGRGRKRISNETVKEVAFAVVERESGSQYSASSVRAEYWEPALSGDIFR